MSFSAFIENSCLLLVMRLLGMVLESKNKELKDAKKLCRADGNCRIGWWFSVGLSLLMTPITLPIVIWSIVTKEQGCPKGACGHSWYKILINPPDVSRKRKNENLMMQYVKMKNKKELKWLIQCEESCWWGIYWSKHANQLALAWPVLVPKLLCSALG